VLLLLLLLLSLQWCLIVRLRAWLCFSTAKSVVVSLHLSPFACCAAAAASVVLVV
jgi:hypothetical protein